MRSAGLSLLLTCACAATLARSASASPDVAPPQEQKARELFEQSRDAVKRGDYASACAGFRESQSLVAASGTLLNLGDCDERSGKLIQALADYQQVLAGLPENDPRARVAASRATALSARIPRLTVKLATGAVADGVRITLEPSGQEVSPGSPQSLDPGDYRVVLHSAQGQDRTLPVTLHESELKEVVADPPAPSVEATPSAPSTAAATPAAAKHDRRTLGFAVGAVGVGLLAVGTATGIAVGEEAATYKAHCKDGCDGDGASAASAGRVLGIVSPVTLAVGAVGAGVGLYFLLTSSRESTTLSARPTAGGGVLTCGGVF
jgi:hypothetical protein